MRSDDGKNGKIRPKLNKLLTGVHRTYTFSELLGLAEGVPAHGGRVEKDDPQGSLQPNPFRDFLRFTVTAIIRTAL